MQTVLVLHNIIRWLILIFGIVTVINALSGIRSKRAYSVKDDKASLFFMVFMDIQLLLGLILFFTNGWFDKIKAGMSEVMKNNYDRFFIIEHSLLMVMAWILVHVGRTVVKRSDNDKKFKKMMLYFGVALLLILLSIPWSFRLRIPLLVISSSLVIKITGRVFFLTISL